MPPDPLRMTLGDFPPPPPPQTMTLPTPLEKGCVSYRNATIYLLDNVAKRLQSDITETATIPWPLQVVELKQEVNLPLLLLQLASLLKKSCPVELDARARTTVSMIAWYIIGDRRRLQLNLI